MKMFAFASALLLSTMSFASTGSHIFKIKDAKFDPKLGLKNDAPGSITVNYDEQTVYMLVARPGVPCAEDRNCPVGMPAPLIVKLPITSIKTDNCGINTVIAQKDQRPVDGILQKIQLVDATDATCQFFRAPDQPATYQSRGVNMLTGKETKTNSKMLLVLSQRTETQEVQHEISSGELLQGYPSLEIVAGGTLSISEEMVKLNVGLALNCPIGTMCPMYMPGPIRAEMKIQSIERSFCGDKITAQYEMRVVDGSHVQKVEITDYTNATCEIVTPHLMVVEYTEQNSGPTQRYAERKARFFVDSQAQ